MTHNERQPLLMAGERMRRVRDELPISQEEAAEPAGISSSQFGMKRHTIFKLGEILPFFEVRFIRQSDTTA